MLSEAMLETAACNRVNTVFLDLRVVRASIYGHVIGDSPRDAVDKVGEILRPSAPKSETSGEYIQ